MTPYSFTRVALITLLALTATFHVIRSAAVSRFSVERPVVAGQFWGDHPRVILAQSMAAIGHSAARGRNIAPQVLDEVAFAAQRAPLDIEPFLINGALAMDEGRLGRAELLFTEARRRDPRSPAARYFLAQIYLSSNRTADGLAETAILSRLVPGAIDLLVPDLARYALSAGSVPELRQLFKLAPELRDPVLQQLAREAENAALVIALAGGEAGRGSPAWQAELLRALVQRGEIAQAYHLWKAMGSQGETTSGLFNPGFANLRAPPPFNWTLQSGSFGVAEPVPAGGLQIIYYGRLDAEFARQLLRLAPGRYELQMVIARQGDSERSGSLFWTLSCLDSRQELIRLPLTGPSGASQRLSAGFRVPPDCASQWLKLGGTAQEPAVSEQVVVTNLQLDARSE